MATKAALVARCFLYSSHIFVLLLGLSGLTTQSVEALHVKLAFPIIGSANFSNDYNAPRSNGPHHAIDIFANKRQKIIAAASGTITFAPVPQPSYGYMVSIRDDEGYRYNYIHLNNDNSGTDDGNGGPMRAYAPYIKPGNTVVRGQHIGYVGDSGNAENTSSHLHFEIESPDGDPINPYTRLTQATRFSSPVEPPQYSFEKLPYGPLLIGLNIAMGNLDNDANSEIVTAPGIGGGPRVRVFETNGVQNLGFYAYDPNNRDGLDIAAADVDGDGNDEIVTVPGRGSGPSVKVFETDGTLISNFYAYNTANRDGTRITAGDVDDDGEDEIITSPMSGSGPSVKVFETDGTLISNFYAYNTANRDGMDIASGDVDNDGIDEIVTGAGRGSGPSVKVFSLNGTQTDGFTAYGSAFRGGVRVAVGNVRNSSAGQEIATIPESGESPRGRLFTGLGTFLEDDYAIENWWRGYYDVAAGQNYGLFGTGRNRRASMIEIF